MVNQIKRILYLLIFCPFLAFSQDIELSLSQEAACADDIILSTVSNCNGTVRWNDGKIGKVRLDTASKVQSLAAECLNGAGEVVSSIAVENFNVYPVPRTPLLFCSDDEIKRGKTSKLQIIGCEYEAEWSTGDTESEIVVKPKETTTYTAWCLNEYGCRSKPISRTVRVTFKGTAPEDPVVSYKLGCKGEDATLSAEGCTNGQYVWYETEENGNATTQVEIGRGGSISIAQKEGDYYYSARCQFQECLGNESNHIYIEFTDKFPAPKTPRTIRLDQGEHVDLSMFLPDPQLSTNVFQVYFNGELLSEVDSVTELGDYEIIEVSAQGTCQSGVSKIRLRDNISGTKIYAAQALLETSSQDIHDEIKGKTPLAIQNTAAGANLISYQENAPLQDYEIARGLSPNGDGANDTFVITKPNDDALQVRIYNKWGHLVYQSEDYRNDWEGKNMEGTYLHDDTYYYVVKTTDGRQKIGFLTLKR